MAETIFAPRPAIAPTPAWDFPSPETFTLANGVTVLHFALADQQLCTVELLLSASTAAEPAGAEGLCMLTVNSLMDGPVGTDSAGFARALQTQAAELGGRTGTEGTTLSLTAPVTRMAAALELLSSTLTAPRFEDADVARQQALQHDEMMMAAYDLANRAGQEFSVLAFPAGHRDQIPPFGLPATLEAITPADVRDFYHGNFTSAQATVVIAGDLSTAQARELLDATLGTWSPAAPEAVAGSAGTAPAVVAGSAGTAPEAVAGSADAVPEQLDLPARAGLFLVEIPDSPQSRVLFALPGPRRTDESWADVVTGVNALGGSMESLLNMRMREEKGYTYGVTARLHTNARQSFLLVESSVDAEAVHEAASDVLDVVSALFAGGISEDDHARSVSELTSSDALGNERSDEIAARAARHVQWGLGQDWPNTERRAILATTAASVSAALRAIDGTRMLMLLAGDVPTDPAAYADLQFGDHRLGGGEKPVSSDRPEGGESTGGNGVGLPISAVQPLQELERTIESQTPTTTEGR